ncbi:MAG: conjugal transfer transcriptional regulator TraJ [Alphaproteobacteria bacterium]|nr:conjugal transfer transcriptional regulator TraJ [Alphaproteobacteria bacterium]
MEGTNSRRAQHLRVPVTQTEKEEIEHNAESVGLSVARFLRNIGIGYEVRSIVDHKQVNELVKINGDLGRLGGLLKMWLTNDARTADFGASTILAVLARIEETQTAMKEIMKAVVVPRSGKENFSG